MDRSITILCAVAGAFLLYASVGSSLFWGSFLVAAGLTYLTWVPFIWIPLGLMIIGGLLSEPFLFTFLVIAFGCAFEIAKKT